MQKKLIALAVAGLASSAAFAQSNVTMYGTLRPSYDFVSTKSEANGDQSISNMNANTSTIGFKGSEDLGNGLKAIFQLEYNLDFTTENDGVGATGGQDQFIGFQGKSWGTVKFGALNNAVKSLFGGYDMFSFSIGDYNNLFSQGVASRNSKAAYYISPNWSGFTLHASYALDTEYDSKDDTTDARKLSFGGDYKLGGLQLTAAYSEGNRPGTYDAESSRFGAAYTFASSKTKVLGVLGVDARDRNGDKEDQYTWMLGVSQPISSNVTLLADYIKAEDYKNGNPDDASAQNWNLGVQYALSKRTSVRGLYSYIKSKNGSGAFDSGYEGIGGAGFDKANAFSVRLQHSF